ncbi:MAG: hypothetical protein ACXWZ0_17055 [Mycobacterium sp.]
MDASRTRTPPRNFRNLSAANLYVARVAGDRPSSAKRARPETVEGYLEQVARQRRTAFASGDASALYRSPVPRGEA